MNPGQRALAISDLQLQPKDRHASVDDRLFERHGGRR